MHPVEHLWQRLADIVREYPRGTAPVPRDFRIEGLGCFPCGYGLWGKQPGRPAPPLPARPVMLIGQDWGTITDLTENHPHGEGEDPSGHFWRNLRPLLERSGISVYECFATNIYPALRASMPRTGPFPGAKDERFMDACRRFMAEQIRVVRPPLIVALGLHVPRFLARLTWAPIGWRDATSWADLNDRQAVLRGVVFTRAGHPVTLVALTHPSYRWRNVPNRRYRGLEGDEAERQMLDDAVSVSRAA
jgi:uracil-DNA glycosylase family 4